MKKGKQKSLWVAWILLSAVGVEDRAEGAVILSSSLSVSEVYNDNLFFTESDRKGDFSTSVSPSARLTYSKKNLNLSAKYRGRAEFHARNSEANGYGHSASFDLGVPILSRIIHGLDVKITEELIYTPELPARSFGVDAGGSDNGGIEGVVIQEPGEGIQLGRVDTLRNRAGVVIGYSVLPELRTTVSYSNVITKFWGGDVEDATVHRTDFGAEYRYDISSRTRWTGRYNVSITFYQDDDEVVAHNFRLNLAHQIGSTISAGGTAGVVIVQGESPRPTFGAQLSKRFKKGTMSIRYTNNIVIGAGIIREATLYQRLAANATRRFWKEISTYLDIGYGSNRSLSGNDVDVSSYTAGAGVMVRLFTWLSGSLRYSYLNQQSQGTTGGDGQRNLATITLTATALPWRITQ